MFWFVEYCLIKTYHFGFASSHFILRFNTIGAVYKYFTESMRILQNINVSELKIVCIKKWNSLNPRQQLPQRASFFFLHIRLHQPCFRDDVTLFVLFRNNLIVPLKDYLKKTFCEWHPIIVDILTWRNYF